MAQDRLTVSSAGAATPCQQTLCQQELCTAASVGRTQGDSRLLPVLCPRLMPARFRRPFRRPRPA